MKVKKKSEKAGLKPSIQKKKKNLAFRNQDYAIQSHQLHGK